MKFLTLEELRQVDEAVFVFGVPPFESAEDRAVWALEHRQRVISGTDLSEDVSASVRQSFERLRIAYAYGVLCYDLFTLVEQSAFFLLEHALGERLLEHYDRVLPLENKKGEARPLEAKYFRDVSTAFRGKNRTYKGDWFLPVPGQEPFPFTASLPNLLAWARAHGYLHGQRGRWSERFFVGWRNDAAHPASHQTHSPADAAKAIRDVAEVVNRLWGVSTPGGRLYPAPIERDPIAVGWNTAREEWGVTLAHNLRAYGEEGWIYVLVRGVFHDDDLTSYMSDFERTTFPTEWLWGPGSHTEAISWLEEHQPGPDRVDYLDRKLFVRVRGEAVELPRRAEVVAALEDDSHDDRWHLVLADFPLMALGHIRTATLGSTECAKPGPCALCQAHTLTSGTRQEVLDYYARAYGPTAPAPLRRVEVPSRDAL